MGERIWTEAQLDAIGLHGHTVLVSAAAGSGKTAVLTERIIRSVMREKDPLDLSRAAIVTFTKAAAVELKERISRALRDACGADPHNKRLTTQLRKLESARIGTIHSFCYEMIRSNFSRLGLSASLRIADETEMRLCRKEIMNRLIDLYYEDADGSCPIEDFGGFVDLFVSDRDDRLADIFIELYRKWIALPDGIEGLHREAEDLRNGGGLPADGWGGVLRDALDGEMAHYGTLFEEAAAWMRDGGKLEKNYYPSFDYDRSYIGQLRGRLKSASYAELRETMNGYSPITLGRGIRAADQTDEVLSAKEFRKNFTARMKKLREQYFSRSEEELAQDLTRLSGMIEKLYLLLREFDTRLQEEKRRRAILDYADLEILAYKLLYDENGRRTDAADAIAQRYDEICIDEYQDTNELQDRIFRAISSENNRFMVGDVKQSIYGFRGAEPDLFSGYRAAFAPYRRGEPIPADAAGLTVFLSNNFRSDRAIIEFTNLVSGCLFSHGSGSIRYGREDELIYSKTDERPSYPVEIMLIDRAAEKKEDGEEREEAGEEDDAASSAEADYVAEEISRLLTQGVRPKDIALLFRSAKNSSKPFEEALRRRKLPYYNDIEKNFFENPEILLALCLLNCIDNPTRDIYLAGVLKSPLYGMTLDELVRIGTARRDGETLYDALCRYTEENGFEKGRVFLEALERYRRYAAAKPVDRLIWYLWQDTGMMAVAEGVERKNLMLLYEYARNFESSSYKGLYNFILYVNDIIEEKQTLENAKGFAESDDTIRLMTVHGSKGLEFRVCFLCGCGTSIENRDLKEACLFESSLGVSLRLRDSTGFVRYTTPHWQAMAMKQDEKLMDEEMRVLYVAMTRAQERLYLTATVRDADKLMKDAEDSAKYLSRYVLERSASYIRWVLTAVKASPDAGCCRVRVRKVTDLSREETTVIGEGAEETARYGNEFSTDDYEALLRERFSFRYPHRRLLRVPAKLTVSRLSPSVLDEEDTSASLDDGRHPTLRTPAFLEEERTEAGAAFGTATHLFMQFADFRRVEEDGVREELARLTDAQFLTEAAARMVNVRALERFFAGPLYREMAQAKKLWREIRFNIKYPAASFTEDAEQKQELANDEVLVQGVIDCFFLDRDGQLVVVDYKTDAIPPDIRSDPVQADAFLIGRYGMQLTYYREACERIVGQKVAKTLLYSFALGRSILLP